MSYIGGYFSNMANSSKKLILHDAGPLNYYFSH